MFLTVRSSDRSNDSLNGLQLLDCSIWHIQFVVRILDLLFNLIIVGKCLQLQALPLSQLPGCQAFAVGSELPNFTETEAAPNGRRSAALCIRHRAYEPPRLTLAKGTQFVIRFGIFMRFAERLMLDTGVDD